MELKIINIICGVILAASISAFVIFNIYEKRVTDTEGPVISMDMEEIEISVEDDESAILKGVKATDSKDGDVTDRVFIESISEFQEDMKRKVDIAAFDYDNHVTKISRIIKYSDYTPIRFDIKRPLRFPAADSEVEMLGRIRAKDCLDGDISSNTVFSEDTDIYIMAPGRYHAVVRAANSAGDIAELPVTVMVYDNAVEANSPRINLSEYLVYLKKGETINPQDFIESITYNNVEYDVTDDEGTFAIDAEAMTDEERREFAKESPSVSRSLFEISDGVDYNTPGTYEIEYTIEDRLGYRGSVILTVIVEGA